MILTKAQVDTIAGLYGDRYEEYGMLHLIETVRALRKALADVWEYDADLPCCGTCEECEKIEKLLADTA